MNVNDNQDIRALSSFAFLESQYDIEGKVPDSLDMLMPLALETLQSFSGSSFNADGFAVRLSEETGLELPLTVVESLLNRCKGSKRRPGYLRKADGLYVRTDVVIECTNLISRRNRIDARHRELLGAIVEYAADNDVGLLTVDEAGRILAGYLDRRFRSLSVGKIAFEGEFSPDSYRWLEGFIIELSDRDSALFDTVVTLVRGRVIYDAAFMPGCGSQEPRLNGLVAYLDSPVLCRYMGFGTESDEKLMREAIHLLKEAGVACRVFEETAAELGRILGGVADHWGRPREFESRGSFLFTMPARGLGRSDAQRAATSPVECIERAGFKVVSTPKREAKFTADETALAERLARKDQERSDEMRIKHDVDCVAAVMTRRGPSYAMSLSKAKHLFVSDSALTIRNTRKWWQEDERRDDVPPIFSIVDLANIAWLYGGVGKLETFTKDALMTTCAASMMPSEKVWQAFSYKLDDFVGKRKVEPDDATTYLFNSCVSDILAHISDSDIEDTGLTDSQMEGILDKSRKAIAEGVNGAELRESKDALADVYDSLEAAERSNREKDKQLESLSKSVDEERRKRVRDRDETEKNLRRMAEMQAKRTMTVITILCILLFAGVVCGYVVMNKRFELISFVGAIPFALFEACSKYLGFYDDLVERYEKKLFSYGFSDGSE